MEKKRNKVLRKLRNERRQADIAKEIGINTSYYGMIESGVRRPSLELAIRISQYFETPIEEIFNIDTTADKKEETSTT